MIKDTVSNLIASHKTNDPFEICENLNIMVNSRDLGNINGYYHKVDIYKHIVLNSERSDTIQRYVCAHELGHALLHTDLNTCFLENNTFFGRDKMEYQADKFAAHLLLPDKTINEYSDYEYTIQQIAQAENVPAELIKHVFDNR